MNVKNLLGPTAVAIGLALAVTTDAHAIEASHLSLPRNMVIAGVDLRAGIYTVEWKIRGTRATVVFSREGRHVATIQGQYETFDRSVATTTLYFSKSSDGEFAIHALGFAGTNKGILFPSVRSHPRQPADPSLDNLLMSPSWGESSALAGPRIRK
jgi:hypothetical protein